jgi:hypothetical protein
MLAAQEMFRDANKVTKPEKALILGFMAGARGIIWVILYSIYVNQQCFLKVAAILYIFVKWKISDINPTFSRITCSEK